MLYDASAFEDGSPQYELSANTAREAEDWIIVLQQATYVCVRACMCVYSLTHSLYKMSLQIPASAVKNGRITW